MVTPMAPILARPHISPRPDAPERDVARALGALGEADLLRLRALARLRARALPGGVAWSDLLHEAVLRALDGSRCWPPGVPLLAFLGGIMRSLADEHWRRYRRERAVLVAWEGGVQAVPDLAPGGDPERRHAAVQALATLDRLFADDPVALRVLTGLAGGLSAEEIRTQFGLGEVEYDTARRRMRRLLLRHGLAWGGPAWGVR